MSARECKLELLDLFFTKINFSQKRMSISNNEYNTSFGINYAVNSSNKTKIKVTIDTTVANEKETIKLELQTVGVFKIDIEGMEDKDIEHLIKVNTVAIIFPYIRSQVSLMTTQPGISPVMIPPINLNTLIKS